MTDVTRQSLLLFLNDDFEQLEDVLEYMRLFKAQYMPLDWDEYDPDSWRVVIPETVFDDMRHTLCDVSGSIFAVLEILARESEV